MEALGDAIISANNTDFMPYVSNELSFQEVNVLDLDSATGPSVTRNGGLPNIGDVVEPSVPNNAAMVITRRTDLRGRSYRGRVYLPGMTRGSLADSVIWGTTRMGQMAAAYNAIWAAGTVLGWTHTVVSYQEDGVARAEGVATEVTAITVRQNVDDMSRRLAGRGT